MAQLSKIDELVWLNKHELSILLFVSNVMIIDFSFSSFISESFMENILVFSSKFEFLMFEVIFSTSSGLLCNWNENSDLSTLRQPQGPYDE